MDRSHCHEHQPRRSRDRGAVSLEMVFIVPVLAMLIFGAVVLGNVLSVKTRTTGFARDGARAAALGLDLPVEDGVTFAVVSGPCPTPTDTSASVTVSATMDVTIREIPFLPTVLPETITETVTMRCGG